MFLKPTHCIRLLGLIDLFPMFLLLVHFRSPVGFGHLNEPSILNHAKVVLTGFLIVSFNVE